MKSIIVAIIVFAGSVAQAVNHQVTVGSGGFVFSPNTVTAAAGDTVEFIVSGTHSVAEAPFGSPCSYLSGGAWSGVSPKPNFVITVADTSSRFFYCSVDGHCPGGMVFALNPSGSESFAAFQSAAEGTSSSVTPPGNPPVGGTSGPVSAPAGSSSSSSAAAPASSSSSEGASTSVSAASSAAASESSEENESTEVYPSSATSSITATSAGSPATLSASTKTSAAPAATASSSSSPGSLTSSPVLQQFASLVGGIVLAAWYFM